MSAMATQHSIAQMTSGMPHGLGLLTTVASLPPKYRSRYLNIKTKCEIPLDLSVKPSSPIPEIASDVPMASTFTEVYTEPSNEPEHRECESQTVGHISPAANVTAAIVVSKAAIPCTTALAITHTDKPITPPPTPTKRKHAPLEQSTAADVVVERIIADAYANPPKLPKINEQPSMKRDYTPSRPIKVTDTAPKTVKAAAPATKPSKHKATRKLKFDEETSSPVSGTIIRPLEDITDSTMQYSNGDIDPKYNIVEITEETKAELAAIKNVIGDYICKLCRIKFEDAFGLAQHRCACIVLLEYRCPECGKQFNCPANLASHRRWHKPKKESAGGAGAVAKKENRNTTNNSAPVDARRIASATKKQEELAYACDECGKQFKRPAYLRKHQLTHKKQQAVHAEKTTELQTPVVESMDAGVITSPTLGSYQSYAGSSTSSVHSSYNGASYTLHSAGSYEYADDEDDVSSECSTSTAGYGRLQIVESGLTEEENIAAAALTNLRNCASVIQHTTLAH